MKKKSIIKNDNIKNIIEDIKIETKPIVRPPDAEIPPDPTKPSKPVEK